MGIQAAALSIALSLCTAWTVSAQSPQVIALYEKARAAQARNDDRQAVADYKEILRLDPSLGAAYNNLGKLYYNLGSYAEAISILSRGLKVDPQMHPAESMLGAALYHTGNYKKAKPLLESAVKAMPDDRFARITLVHTLLADNDPNGALQQLQVLTARDPKDQEAWYLLGKVDLQLSQEAFARVRSIDPNAPLAHELSGEIMESIKNTPGAIAEYKKALELAPGNIGAMEHLADAYWHAGEWAEARDAFTAMLPQKSTSCLIHWKLANSLDELDETPANALEQVDLALATCPSFGQARVERARILIRLAKPADALPELLEAEKTAPDEPSIQILLAKVYKALGDPARAAAANARFHQLDQAEHAEQEKHAADVLHANP